jgi:carboxymethylenebutenolidase
MMERAMPRTAVTIQTQDGQCPASVFRPKGSGPWPAVIVFLDGPGIRPALFDLGERLAGNGYFVLLPDLFYRAGPYPPNDVAALFGNPDRRKAWQETYQATATSANVMRDMGAYLAFLDAQPDVKRGKIGTTGYCMGGGLSLTAAGTYPERVAAAASFHGGRLATDAPDSPHRLVPKIKAKVYVAGAVEDPSFPDDMKQRLHDAFTQAGTDHTLLTYEGARHGWVPTDTLVHNPAAAERHWTALVGLLDQTLKGWAA